MVSQLKSLKTPWHLIIVFFLFSIGIGTTGYLYYQDQKEDIKQDKQNELSTIADLKTKQIIDWRKERMEDSGIILGSPFIAHHIQQLLENQRASLVEQEILEWMESLQRHYHYQSIHLFDAKGTERLSVPKVKEAFGVNEKTFVMEAMQNKKVFLSGFYRIEATNIIRLSLLVPISIFQGRGSSTAGALLLRIDPFQFLYPLIQSWPTPSLSSEILLVRREGDKVVLLNELRHRKGTALNLRFPMSEQRLLAVMAVRGKEGIVEGIDHRGVPVLASIIRIPDSPWFLISKVDQEEIYALIRVRAGFIAIIVGILIFGAAMSVVFLWRGQRAEFERMQYAVELERRTLTERLDYLTRYANDIILLIDRDLKIVEANERALELYGYPRDEFLLLNARDLRSPETRPLIDEQMKQVEEKNGAIFETIHQRKDGATFPVEISARVIEVKGEKFYQSIIRDITERKQADEALREIQRSLEAVLETATSLIVLTDPDGRIILFNHACEELTGYKREEVLGKTIPELFLSPEWIPIVQKRFADPYAPEVRAPHENPWITKSGEERLIEWRCTVLPSPKDGRPCILGTGVDITERKRAEEALKESEEKFRGLYNNAPVGYHEYDVEGRLTSVNRTELEMLGYSREEMMGQPVWNFIVEVEKSRESVMAKLAGVELPGRQFKRTYQRKDGTTFPVLIEDRILRDPAGSIIGIRSTIQDITNLNRAEEERDALQDQLRQSLKMEAIGRLAGGIAHDFNNLLTVIRGYSQLSLIEMKKGDPFRPNIEEIKRATDRAADLIRQLLAFSRRQTMEMKVLDLNTILRNLDKMLRRVIGEDIELKTLLAENLGRVKVDPGHIEQVIMNLVVNAKDAMPDGGKLIIETANVDLDEEYARNHVAVTPGYYVMLSVSDTGVGMTLEAKERIFEPFFTTKEKGKGTGLGLSTVYGIVKQSGGNIWVYSEPGKGTTFKIYLPQVEEPLEELKEKVVEKDLPRGTETILVVEDEEEVRKLALRILSGQGYTVLEAAQGVDALLICEEHEGPIHLLLTDVIMPVMSGRELADRVASIWPETKVLYMSGYTDNAIFHNGVLDKRMNYIQKPFTIEGLAKKVREVLDKE